MPRCALPVALLAALAVAGCGASDRATDATQAPATAPAATTATTATAPATASASSPPATTVAPPTTADPGGASADEAQPGGAGDEEPIRQPVSFVVGATAVEPGAVSVAPFLPVALTVINSQGVARSVRLVGAGVAFTVPAGGRVERRVPGMKAGTYTLAVDGGKVVASLVVGNDVGP